MPVIRTEDNGNAYLANFNVRQAVKFNNILLFTNSLNKARWLSGYNADFSNVTVQRTNGDSGGCVFDFASRNSFRGGSITAADASSGFFRVQGDANLIDKPTLVAIGDSAAPGVAVLTLSSGSARNVIDYLITGSVGAEFASGAAATLGNNDIKNARDNNASIPGGGQKNALHKEYLKLTGTAPATYTGFVNGYTGSSYARHL